MKANEARKVSLSYSKDHNLISSDVFDYIIEQASEGHFSAMVYPSQFKISCLLNSQAPTQHKLINRIVSVLEDLGYTVTLLYPNSDKLKPVDCINIEW